MMDSIISLIALLIAVFALGTAFGKLEEKIEHYIRKSEDMNHINKKSNRQHPEK